MHNKTIQEAYRMASSFLLAHELTEAQFEAEWMLRELLGIDRAQFFLHWDQRLNEEQAMTLQQWLERRASDEPLQYIFGHADFYGRSFQVTPAVLIPRPETELLVEHVLRYANDIWGDAQPLHVVDVGTGSGCIPITLQLERPVWQVTAVDLSARALAIAQQNARAHAVEGCVRFLHGSYLYPVAMEAVDIVVSNPPYIPSTVIRTLDDEVQYFEPHLALDGGDDGLAPYRALAVQIAELPPIERLIAFEIGAEQGEQVASLLRPLAAQVDILPDMNGLDRYVIAKS